MPVIRTFIPVSILAALLAGCGGSGGGALGGLVPSGQTQLGSVENTVQNAGHELVKCAAPVGVAALVEPTDEVLLQLRELGLSSPTPVLRLLMARSGCFQVVDRGAASEALQRERELAAAGELQEGSDIGGGQMVAADFLVSATILFQDHDAGGSNIGGALGALLPGVLGIIAGSINVQNLEAQVLLTLTNVRSGIQEAVAEGSARKSDVGFGVGALAVGASVGGAGGGGSYTSTDIGKIIMAAFVDGHNKLVARYRPA